MKYPIKIAHGGGLTKTDSVDCRFWPWMYEETFGIEQMSNTYTPEQVAELRHAIRLVDAISGELMRYSFEIPFPHLPLQFAAKGDRLGYMKWLGVGLFVQHTDQTADPDLSSCAHCCVRLPLDASVKQGKALRLFAPVEHQSHAMAVAALWSAMTFADTASMPTKRVKARRGVVYA